MHFQDSLGALAAQHIRQKEHGTKMEKGKASGMYFPTREGKLTGMTLATIPAMAIIRSRFYNLLTRITL